MRVHKDYDWYKVLLNPMAGIWQVLLYKGEAGEDGMCDAVFKQYKGEPSMKAIMSDAMQVLNTITDTEIVSGFKWDGHLVWLSRENQMNYFFAFVLAILTQGETLPVTFKIGTDEAPHLVTFKTVDELKPFITGAFRHIYSTLEKGWARKYKEVDWKKYEQAQD